MTVKSLSDLDKANIADYFLINTTGAMPFYAKTEAINNLSEIYSRSRRTIIRALEEQGIDPGVKHRKPKEKTVDIALTFPDHPVIPVHTPVPWYRKVLRAIGLNVYAS